MTDVLKTFDLTGRTAIVTGGAGLLGREFCRSLAEAGAAVAVADLDRAAAARVAEERSAAGQRALAVEVDVTREPSIREAVETVLKTYSSIDILVNSAAIDPKFDAGHTSTGTASFEDFPLQVWNEALAVNLTGMFLFSRAVAKPMLKQGRGVIVNLCSTYGLVGPDQRIYQKAGQPVQYKPVYYSVTKAGVLGLTRYLATYFAGRNIRVNSLTPGGVFNQNDEDFVRNYSARTVLGRMANKDEMNAALLFLASDASTYMTGSNLIVDGGWTAW